MKREYSPDCDEVFALVRIHLIVIVVCQSSGSWCRFDVWFMYRLGTRSVSVVVVPTAAEASVLSKLESIGSLILLSLSYKAFSGLDFFFNSLISDKEIVEMILFRCLWLFNSKGCHLNTHVSPALGFMLNLTLGQISSSLTKPSISSCNFSTNGPVLVAVVVLNNTDGGTSDSVDYSTITKWLSFSCLLLRGHLYSVCCWAIGSDGK